MATICVIAIAFIAIFVTIVMGNRIQELEKALEESERKGGIDPLTGLPNRRVLESAVKNEIERSNRYEHELSCLFIDLDNFKPVNDTLGHKEGDTTLKDVSRVIREVCRETDTKARVGGDEFVVLLPETSCEDAEMLAKRLSAQIARLIPEGKLPNGMQFGASIGCVTHSPGESYENFFERADSKMYGVKRLKDRRRTR